MRLLKKFNCAFAGLFLGLKQASIWLQIALAFVAILTFLLLKISYFEWLVVVVMIAIVILCEWINSIIEMTVDYISLERQVTARKIKDLSAGLVLLSGFFALAIGLMIIVKNLS